MRLSDEYKRQLKWRDWTRVLEHLPIVKGRTVLDLGCGVGDLAAEFAARGARVIGIDLNRDLIDEARSRALPDTEFRVVDLRTVSDFGVPADGVWCSFTAAYLLDLPDRLSAWAGSLNPRGWVALTEIDDLFGHEPLDAEAKGLLARFVEDALAAKRYDFRMGRKLEGHLERSGFVVSTVLHLEDRELAFDGPALPEVVDAWRLRFDRMNALRDFCGARMEQVRESFLDCLRHPDHRSLAKVVCCVATKAGAAS